MKLELKKSNPNSNSSIENSSWIVLTYQLLLEFEGKIKGTHKRRENLLFFIQPREFFYAEIKVILIIIFSLL